MYRGQADGSSQEWSEGPNPEWEGQGLVFTDRNAFGLGFDDPDEDDGDCFGEILIFARKSEIVF